MPQSLNKKFRIFFLTLDIYTSLHVSVSKQNKYKTAAIRVNYLDGEADCKCTNQTLQFADYFPEILFLF